MTFFAVLLAALSCALAFSRRTIRRQRYEIAMLRRENAALLGSLSIRPIPRCSKRLKEFRS